MKDHFDYWKEIYDQGKFDLYHDREVIYTDNNCKTTAIEDTDILVPIQDMSTKELERTMLALSKLTSYGESITCRIIKLELEKRRKS